MTDAIGVMICGHGSRDPAAVEEFGRFARRLADFLPFPAVEYGYLEFARPVIRDGLDRLREQGIRRVLAVPGMLFAAGHAKNDIPSVLNTYQAQHAGLDIRYGRELGIDPKMLRAAGDRIEQALVRARPGISRHETLLMVVGRGSSDPDANSNVCKVMRFLWEGMGFGWGETAYSGVTFPLVEPALDHAVRLGFRRIVVFPYFLFTGILVDRIYEHTDLVAARYPGVDFVKAPYLNDHPLVLASVADRVAEILDGPPAMNCQLCKYREQVLGFEAEVGLRQESHHHHVEGIGVGTAAANGAGPGDHDHGPGDHHHGHDAHDGGHSHGHGHGNGHHHHDHPHDHDHPHGHGHGGHHHDHDHDEGPAADRSNGHDHPHPHHGGDGHGHGHGADGGHHHPYPHADHPLGPRSLRS